MNHKDITHSYTPEIATECNNYKGEAMTTMMMTDNDDNDDDDEFHFQNNINAIFSPICLSPAPMVRNDTATLPIINT